MKIFQIVNGKCHWQTPFASLEETANFPPDCIFVEAPDYVNEQWGFDDTEIGDDRFIKPEVPEGFIYNEENGQIMEESAAKRMFEESQAAKQSENNNGLAEALKTHPLTWIDGKQYGITKEDQNEIAMNLVSYQNALTLGVENPVLEWHAVKEACVPWEPANLMALSEAIRQAVYPYYNINQQYKERIYACKSTAELDMIEIDYRTEEEKTAANPDSESSVDEETK